MILSSQPKKGVVVEEAVKGGDAVPAAVVQQEVDAEEEALGADRIEAAVEEECFVAAFRKEEQVVVEEDKTFPG